MASMNKAKTQITENNRKVLAGLRKALNEYPLRRRIVLAWRLIRGKF